MCKTLPRPAVVLNGQLPELGSVPPMGSVADAAPGPAFRAAGKNRRSSRCRGGQLCKVDESDKGVQTSSGRNRH